MLCKPSFLLQHLHSVFFSAYALIEVGTSKFKERVKKMVWIKSTRKQEQPTVRAGGGEGPRLGLCCWAPWPAPHSLLLQLLSAVPTHGFTQILTENRHKFCRKQHSKHILGIFPASGHHPFLPPPCPPKVPTCLKLLCSLALSKRAELAPVLSKFS